MLTTAVLSIAILSLATKCYQGYTYYGHTFQVQLPVVPPAAEGSKEGSPVRPPLRTAASGTGYGALMNSNSDPFITCTGV